MRADFHHIGLACHSIALEEPFMADLGLVAEGIPIDDPIQNVRVQFYSGPGPRIELIEPLGPQSPIQGVLKRGTRLYHLAYTSTEFDICYAELSGRGYRAMTEPAPAAAFDMNRIVFMLSPTLMLIELIDAGPTKI